MLPLQSWAMDGENRRHVPVGLDDQHPSMPELRTNPQIERSLVRVVIHDLLVLHRDVFACVSLSLGKRTGEPGFLLGIKRPSVGVSARRRLEFGGLQ